MVVIRHEAIGVTEPAHYPSQGVGDFLAKEALTRAKGEWSGSGDVVSSDAGAAPLVNRWDLTRTGMHTARGKPDTVPLGRDTARYHRCGRG